jgi:hypothetical protein
MPSRVAVTRFNALGEHFGIQRLLHDVGTDFRNYDAAEVGSMGSLFALILFNSYAALCLLITKSFDFFLPGFIPGYLICI